MESLIAFKRAGADGALTHFAARAAGKLRKACCSNPTVGARSRPARKVRIRPFTSLRDRPDERAGSARKRSSAEGVGCAVRTKSNLRWRKGLLRRLGPFYVAKSNPPRNGGGCDVARDSDPERQKKLKLPGWAFNWATLTPERVIESFLSSAITAPAEE